MSRQDVRVDVKRRREDGRYRWEVRVPGHLLAVSDRHYARRIDCLHAARLAVGFTDVSWLNEGRDARIYDYGQSRRGGQVIEVFVWKRWWRR